MEEFVKNNSTTLSKNIFDKVRKLIRLTKKGEINIHKIINILLCGLSRYLKINKNLGKPFFVIIETSNLCNLQCPLCPTGEKTLNRKIKNMPFLLFKKIIDEIGNYCITINITNYGEPLLNNELYDMIYYAKRHNIKIVLGTNAHFINTEKDRFCLISSGLDQIYFSLDGAKQETYELYRKKGNFSIVINNIKKLIELRNKLGVNNPTIELQFLVMKHNEHEIDEIRKIAKDLKVDRLSLKPVSFNNADWKRPEILSRYLNYEPKNEKYRLYNKTNGKLYFKEEIKNGCAFLWKGPTILVDGTIVPCCMDPRNELELGNINDGIHKVWNNKRYRKLRRDVNNNKKKIQLCSKCPGE